MVALRPVCFLIVELVKGWSFEPVELAEFELPGQLSSVPVSEHVELSSPRSEQDPDLFILPRPDVLEGCGSGQSLVTAAGKCVSTSWAMECVILIQTLTTSKAMSPLSGSNLHIHTKSLPTWTSPVVVSASAALPAAYANEYPALLHLQVATVINVEAEFANELCVLSS
jgi:hypothetical protein